MRYVSPIRARRLARRAAAATTARIAAAETAMVEMSVASRAIHTKATVFHAALTAIDATTSAIKVPNGTTKKIARIVGDALATA